MIMSNKLYDVLKWICLVLMPAAIALYASLSGTWGWPYAEQITATMSAVELFMGAALQISNARYKASTSIK